MSIYCTLWEIQVRDDPDRWVEVYAQAVPPHVGHPSQYPDGDPYTFLPPVSTDYDPLTGDGTDRAVVILQGGYDDKDGQRYTDPLLVLTGGEYLQMPWQEMLERIHRLVRPEPA